MFDQLFKSFQEKVTLTPAEMELCKTFFIPKKLRKKQVLLQEGDVCIYNAFVEKGHEHTVQFAIEGWWITDLSSFLTNSHSIYTIEALEDSELLLLTTEARESLMDQIPMFERYQRLLLQNAYIANQARINSTLTETAEEKFIKLGKAYPGIVQRVPQHMLASYLGFTAETLSRIRKHLREKE
ncbi:Crp/Fnr family transcriptional regulator [Flavobacterium sp. FPG59]|uniref:Crp/Fnr family transcriptional regulator n=1 Tax=Flavobacterium sp. FPG59 TaxID=1929267 RepID=UPI000A37765A|nr:Crp/Fnr family transcriptional regulator [Flavobacterium sp. FPG59]OUD36110.1 cyclic nucleotide-binding protein [Flavobacterium sp. FPG59]